MTVRELIKLLIDHNELDDKVVVRMDIVTDGGNPTYELTSVGSMTGCVTLRHGKELGAGEVEQ